MSNIISLTHKKYRFTPPHPINPNWKQIENFKNKNCFLEKTALDSLSHSIESCDRIEITHKFSRKFSCSERVLRILLGLILVTLTLGISLIFKPIRQLFYKDHVSVKVVQPIWLSKDAPPEEVSLEETSNNFPTFSTFQEIDQVKLQQIIVDRIDDILYGTATFKDIKHFGSRNYIFSLTSFPGWIFKICFYYDSEETTQRFAYTEYIRQVCKQNNFDHLVIPESHLITVNIDGKPVPIIVEKQLNIENNPQQQEAIYIQHYKEYTRALKQLVHLICQTDLHDIKWENCPLLFDHSTNSFSKIALIDLEKLPSHSKDSGLFGLLKWRRGGIIQCVPPQHFPTIKSIISIYNKSIIEYERCVQQRLQELQDKHH